MTNADLVVALCVAVLGWFLLVEALHCGVSVVSVLRPGRPGALPWRVLGPLVLVDEVWLVVLLVLPATGLGTPVEDGWRQAWLALLLAILLSSAQFALLLLAPVMRNVQGARRALAVTGTLLPVVWAVALGLAFDADPLLAGSYGVAALAAALTLGHGVLDRWGDESDVSSAGRRWPVLAGLTGAALALAGASAWAENASTSVSTWVPVAVAGAVTFSSERQALVRVGVAAAALLALIGAAVASTDALRSDADPATLRIVVVTALLTLPVLIALQAWVWRLAVAAWAAQRPLQPVHARPVAVPVGATRPVDGSRR